MKEIILITISGEDKPGLSSTIGHVLAEHSANILDIGQSVIHESLSLGMLVEFPDSQRTSEALKEIFHILFEEFQNYRTVEQITNHTNSKSTYLWKTCQSSRNTVASKNQRKTLDK